MASLVLAPSPPAVAVPQALAHPRPFAAPCPAATSLRETTRSNAGEKGPVSRPPSDLDCHCLPSMMPLSLAWIMRSARDPPPLPLFLRKSWGRPVSNGTPDREPGPRWECGGMVDLLLLGCRHRHDKTRCAFGPRREPGGTRQVRPCSNPSPEDCTARLRIHSPSRVCNSEHHLLQHRPFLQSKLRVGSLP
ncbi:hypothetical protein CDD83_8736 [Cordyceps sp. RAO-2017]|nr:hypothetical protein CDD83_8736 [Cordyceps sp. RAO-2017]